MVVPYLPDFSAAFRPTNEVSVAAIIDTAPGYDGRPAFIPPEIPPPSQARATADSIKRAIPAFARLIASGRASYDEAHYAIMRAYAMDCDTGDERAFQQAETRISALLVAAVHRAELTA